MRNIKNSKLVKFRKRNFNIGLTIALTFVIFAFGWEKDRESIKFDASTTYAPNEEMNLTPRTFFKKPRVTPPVIKEVTNIEEIIDDVDFVEEPVKKVTDIDEVIKYFKDEGITNKVMETPKPPIVKTHLPPVIVDVPEIFIIVEEMPRFGDCDDDLSKDEKKACSDQKMLNYIHSHIRYPSIAKENRIEGKVYVSFIVDKNGNTKDIKILIDIGGGCGQEVLQIIKNMPSWAPGKQRGNAVNVLFNLPVEFKLN